MVLNPDALGWVLSLPVLDTRKSISVRNYLCTVAFTAFSSLFFYSLSEMPVSWILHLEDEPSSGLLSISYFFCLFDLFSERFLLLQPVS